MVVMSFSTCTIVISGGSSCRYGVDRGPGLGLVDFVYSVAQKPSSSIPGWIFADVARGPAGAFEMLSRLFCTKSHDRTIFFARADSVRTDFVVSPFSAATAQR